MGFLEKETVLRRLGVFLILGMITFMHFAVTFVVVLFILSTINITNRNIPLPFDLKYLEITVTAVIFIISAIVFIKSVKRTSQFIREIIFRRPHA